MRIVIIGATSGIGREMARLYANGGHRIGITGRRNELLEEVKASRPHAFVTACYDAASSDAVAHLQRLIDELGGMDLLIYNAGFGQPSKELVAETEIATTETNVMGFVRAVTFAFNYFLQQGHGQVAVTSSVAALRGNSATPAYSASKAYASNYCEGLNIKAARLGKPVYVTDIRPGFIKTKMAKGEERFWVSEPGKAARQMVQAIERKKRVAYITRRWWLVAQVMKAVPYALYRRLA